MNILAQSTPADYGPDSSLDLDTNSLDEIAAEKDEDLADLDEQGVTTRFVASGIPGVEFTSEYEICLRPFLEALGWEGNERKIVEAIPHLDPIKDLDTFRAVISRLGFRSRTYRVTLKQIGNYQLPALVIFDDDKPVLLLSAEDRSTAFAFDPSSFDFKEIQLDRTKVTCCLAEGDKCKAKIAKNNRRSWFLDAIFGLKRPLGAIVALTCLANLLALATPIYVMNVYNLVITGKNFETLPFFFAVVAITMMFEIFLKRKRGQLLGFFGARLGAGIMNAGLSRLLGLPVSMIEAAPIGTQIIRLKQFEGTHNFFTGPVGVAFIELPFLLLFFAVIALISPVLTLVPFVLAVTYGLVALLAAPEARRRNNELNDAVADSNSYLMDAIGKKFSIHQLCAEQDWSERFIKISRSLAHKRFQTQFFDSMFGAISQSLMMLAGVSTMFIGAALVMSEDLSIGGLIAIMMLIWRILAPIQTIFTNLNRISQFIDTAKQIDVLMGIPLERETGANAPVVRRFKGRLTFGGVAFRYGQNPEPVFRGLNLDIPARQFVCISSAVAGGKSTILKLILGLYRPQAGAIFLDGLNLLQLDPADVRASIGYLPLEPEFFYGTIAQNLRLSEPMATDEEVEQALCDAGLDMKSKMFPEGIKTRLTSERLRTLPIGTKQCLSLARLYCRKANIFLLNDPAANLDEAGEHALVEKLTKMKGSATIILIGNRSEHFRLSDRVVKLANGVVSEDYDPSSR